MTRTEITQLLACSHSDSRTGEPATSTVSGGGAVPHGGVWHRLSEPNGESLNCLNDLTQVAVSRGSPHTLALFSGSRGRSPRGRGYSAADLEIDGASYQDHDQPRHGRGRWRRHGHLGNVNP